ncbi:MAG: hypothetical protein KGH74_04295 [Candidatus Micrarchaeota archaeon]|nr:hypothetical protein [Candidatus Micrarchaeota archaeon]
MADVVQTGIAGLDTMLFGGIPAKNQVILAGGPGAGKTLLAFEFLYKNAKMGNKSVFFSIDESPDRVLKNARQAFPQFTEIDQLLDSKNLVIEGEDPQTSIFGSSDNTSYEFGKLVSDIESLVTSEKATRIVIDSSSILEILVKDPLSFRRSMISMATNFRRLGVTSILTSELPDPERSGLKFKSTYFIFDGIIVMYQMVQEQRRIPGIEVIKMRGTKHSFVTAPYEITPEGFKIFTTEDATAFM